MNWLKEFMLILNQLSHKTQYDWSGGKPVVSNETIFDWSGGKPRIVYEYIAAPPVGQPYISRVQGIPGMKTIGVNL